MLGLLRIDPIERLTAMEVCLSILTYAANGFLLGPASESVCRGLLLIVGGSMGTECCVNGVGVSASMDQWEGRGSDEECL